MMEEPTPPSVAVKANYDAKLKEILHRINSPEIKLCSDATKEFIKLLKSESGRDWLYLYVQSSSKFTEILDAWKSRKGKEGVSYVMSLVSVMLSHPDGLYKPGDVERGTVSRALDKLGQVVVKEKLGDVYKELGSKEGRRQSVALGLVAAVVRRGSGLAMEVAKSFDFRVKEFLWVAKEGSRLRRKGKKGMGEEEGGEKRRVKSSRKMFVEFAMSFLEVGKPGLLRWVLQQREMYSGVLRGLGEDDEETVVYVLSTLKDRVLVDESLVPPGLRSVLFGNVTLEKLVGISGRGDGGVAADLAHDVLVMVCTDPCNGLMPDSRKSSGSLKGNPKRLLGVMKKLKATEIIHHRDLLLKIVRGRPFFGSAYLEEFPYNLEDHALPNWFAAVTLAARLLSSVATGFSFDALFSQYQDLPAFEDANVQNVMKCICPHPFNRSVINKGLLHPDILVKHGTLRLLLEMMKFLDSFISALDNCSSSNNRKMDSWGKFKQIIQNEVRIVLPDSQVLLNLLSSSGSQSISRGLLDRGSSKRAAEHDNLSEHYGRATKKLKTSKETEDSDIIIGGLDASSHPPGENAIMDDTLSVSEDESDDSKTIIDVIIEIWGLDHSSSLITTLKDAGVHFNAMLLDALKLYMHSVPLVLEGSFDFFINLLHDPLSMPANFLHSLLSLLAEYIIWSQDSGNHTRTPLLMYKHLQLFLNLLVFSSDSNIKEQSYKLARAAMLSTGAFDSFIHEVEVWFMFLPGYTRDNSFGQVQRTGVLQSFTSVVISFLCDATSTVGNNLFKYWEIARGHIDELEGFKDVSPCFSPLVICVLQKSLRLLNSSSGTFSLPQKSMISLYVCNTLKHLVQMQVDGMLLCAFMESFLSGNIRDLSLVNVDDNGFYGWWPLKNLLLFTQSICHKQTCMLSFNEKHGDSSLANTLKEVKRSLRRGCAANSDEIADALCLSVICATPDAILNKLPSLLTVSHSFLEVLVPLLVYICCSEPDVLVNVSTKWPQMFLNGFEMAVHKICNEGETDSSLEDARCSITSEERTSMLKHDVSESAAALAFSKFLTQVPFHVLFPTVMSIEGGSYILKNSKIHGLLVAELSNVTTDCILPSLRLLLFWIHQVQSFYKNKPSREAEEVSEKCFALFNHLLGKLSVLNAETNCPTNAGASCSARDIVEVTEMIFNHPVVSASLTCSLGCSKELQNRLMDDTFQNILSSAGQRAQRLDGHVLDMLTNVCKYLFSPTTGPMYNAKNIDGSIKRLVIPFNRLVQRMIENLKDMFEFGVETKDLNSILPAFDALDSLVNFLPPLELLDLARWMFSRVNADELTVDNWKISALSLGCYVAAAAFESFSCYLKQPMAERIPYNLFWEMDKKRLDFQLVEETYLKVFTLATCFQLHVADECLLKAIISMYRQKCSQYHNLHPFCLTISQVIVTTPVDILSHCMSSINITKAKILCLLTEMSHLHLTVFGQLIHGLLNKEAPFYKDLNRRSCNLSSSDDDLLLFLPAALSYLSSIFSKFKEQHCNKFKIISSLYSRIILDGFTQWGSFVSRHVFKEDYDNNSPSSVDELLSLFDNSFLGKAIGMLHYQFALNRDFIKVKRRVKLFEALVSSEHDVLLDCDVHELETHTVSESLNIINRVVAKISVCKLLIFPECSQSHILKDADGDLEDLHSETRYKKLDTSKMRFMNILVNTWQCIVRELPSASDVSKNESSFCMRMYGYMEVFVSKSILDLITCMHDSLTSLCSIPFLESLVKSAFLYRFKDPSTLKMLCRIFSLLSDGRLSCVNYIQLLVAHSQFAQCICSISKAVVCPQIGALSRPMSSILRSLVIPSSDRNQTAGKNGLEAADKYTISLEVLKLLRMLIECSSNQSDLGSCEDIGINLRELQLLLWSSYGATLSELDLEIYYLVDAIDSINRSDSKFVTDIDYLWGSAALQVRNEQELDEGVYANDNSKSKEAIDERCSRFRESLPLDPRICASTVLYFPFDRTASGDMKLMCERPSAFDNIQRYDPIFILRFSIHSLSMGYLEPVEFSGLGLLAVALMSLSSPDDGIRRLAYETLGRFKNALEESQKRKDVTRLRILLTCVQNGIEEPWQKIPSIIALFAAESSLILLDPSHDHHAAINKLLTRSSRINLKCIPLFKDYFWSSSVNFKMEKLWILRLAYAGLNSDDDAQIYIRNSILEILLSFYVSPLADDDSKVLILKMLDKSVKFHKLSRYLVEHCGLLSWLSSIASTHYLKLCVGEEDSFLAEIAVVLKIVGGIISSRNIVEWLQIYALEQLMELSSHLYNLLISSYKLIQDFALVDSVLHILTSTLKISQKRKIYQPHYTLSVDSLMCTYHAVNICENERLSDTGLRAILMSTPQLDLSSMNQEQLSKFTMWVIATALKSDSKDFHMSKDSHLHCMFNIEEGSREDSLTSKLLRWLSAAVILRKLPPDHLYSKSSKRSDLNTLESLLEHIRNGDGEKGNSGVGSEEMLAAAIFYLQLLHGINFNVLPSVVSALCILLHIDSFSIKDFGSKLLLGDGSSLASVWSKIRCPAEASPSWRWTFYQPWKDLSVDFTELQKMDELHACQVLLFIVSTVLQKKSSDISDQLEEFSHSFAWERRILQA